MDAITAMKTELLKIQSAMAECETEWGFVKNECKYRYIILSSKAAAMRESIEWMSSTYQEA